jgi:hypothetical protein
LSSQQVPYQACGQDFFFLKQLACHQHSCHLLTTPNPFAHWRNNTRKLLHG